MELKVGDLVSPKPNYERRATIRNQHFKCTYEKNWLYHAFRVAKVIAVYEDGTVDIATKKSIWVRIPPEMLEKIKEKIKEKT